MVDYKYKFLVEEGHSTDIYHSFIDLWDTPSNYAGSQSYVLVVTPTESGVQFTNKLSNIGFDTTVSGVDPTNPYDLTTKNYVDAVSSGAGIHDICVAFAAYDKNFYKFKDYTDWEECTVFVFRGSDILGIPTSAKVVAKMDGNTSPNGQMRLYDLTNNKIIATWSAINSNQDAIYTTSVSNIPSGESMFSVQGKKGGSYTLLRSLTLVF
jgi:hypothetical protein